MRNSLPRDRFEKRIMAQLHEFDADGGAEGHPDLGTIGILLTPTVTAKIQSSTRAFLEWREMQTVKITLVCDDKKMEGVEVPMAGEPMIKALAKILDLKEPSETAQAIWVTCCPWGAMAADVYLNYVVTDLCQLCLVGLARADVIEVKPWA